jgi:hypothetical protein
VVTVEMEADQDTELVDPALNVAHPPILPVARFTLRADGCPEPTTCRWIPRPVT